MLHHTYPFLNRRDVLVGGMASAILAVVPLRSANAQNAYRLTALPAKTRITAEPAGETDILSYNSQMPGPLIRARQGQKLRIEFENK